MLSVEHQKRVVLERLYHCKMALDSISNYPDSSSPDAETFRASIDAFIKAHVISFQSKYVECHYFPAARRDAQRIQLCGEYSEIILELTSKYIPALEAASSRNVPVHLVSFLRSEVRRVGSNLNLGPVILATQYEYNYSVSNLSLRELSDLTQEDSEPVAGDTYLVIRLPRIERDSVPLHAVLLGHEIGHVRAWNDEATSNLVRFVPAEVLATARTAAAEAALTALCISIMDNWYSEFAADIYGALTYGPAALLALAELTGPMTPPTLDSLTHPSTAMRLAVMLRVLAASGFNEGDSRFGPMWQEFSRTATLDHDVPNFVRGSLWPVIRSQLDILIEICTEAVGEERFTLDRWNEVERGSDFLASGLPVGEMGDELSIDEMAGERRLAVDPAIILNAAWLCKMRDNQGLCETLELDGTTVSGILRSSVVLDQLVLKSFEIAASLNEMYDRS